MIEPNMATMLVYLYTNADVSKADRRCADAQTRRRSDVQFDKRRQRHKYERHRRADGERSGRPRKPT